VPRIREQLARDEDSLGLIEAAERAGDTLTLEALRSEVERFGLVHRADLALARHGGELSSRAAARYLVGPYCARFEADLNYARSSVFWEGNDLAGAARRELAGSALDLAIRALTDLEARG
jgi:hypothetical protein